MKVYLDDIRQEPDGWTRAYTAAEAIEFLETGKVEKISLDHDLSLEHYSGELNSETGYAVILWLENKVINDKSFIMPKVYLHTMNPVAREHMQKGLERIARILHTRSKPGSTGPAT